MMDFEGRWRLSRRIEDAKTGGTGLFEGVAVFTREGAGLAYEEAGELRLPDGPGMAATRRYTWRPGDGAIDVMFDDGRDFHRIALDQPVVTAFHDCPPDFYEVSYNFTHWPDWRAIWRVTGPRKDYTMISDYRR
nr:DUF6314 family protein [Aliiroseovarius subalbicans]